MGNFETTTKVGGLRAVDMKFRAIREFEFGELQFLQSRTRLNTPDLGILVPETFRKVSELSNQCISLFELELRQLIENIKMMQESEIYFRWVSMYMPLRFLESKDVQKYLMDKMDESRVDTNKICFELSPDILFDGKPIHGTNIEHLRNRGFHFMLTNFGGMNSPLIRLAYYPVDYVQLSEEMNGYLVDDSRSLAAVESIVEFASGLGAETIADGVTSAEQAELLFKAQCRYGSGPLVGKYVASRHLKNKKEDKKEDN